MKIIATNGITTQEKSLKPETTIEKAKEILRDYYENDYLGLDYYLEDNQGNEIAKFEQED